MKNRSRINDSAAYIGSETEMNIQIMQRGRRIGNRVRHQNDENFEDDDIDPDLRNEVEIHFTARDYQLSAKSRQTASRKSGRKSETGNSLPSTRIVKSRGRPIKPHEVMSDLTA